MRRIITGALAVATAATIAAAAHPTPVTRQHKVPADAATPSAGFCDTTTARFVNIDVEPDAPSTRCWQVRPGQRLRVSDDLSTAVRIRWRPYAQVTLRAGQTVTFDRPFASYLQPGDHRAWISAYAGGGVDVVLPTHRHQAPAPAAG